jgi:hypothetical protein
MLTPLLKGRPPQEDAPDAQDPQDLKDVSGFRRPSNSVRVPRDVRALRRQKMIQKDSI